MCLNACLSFLIEVIKLALVITTRNELPFVYTARFRHAILPTITTKSTRHSSSCIRSKHQKPETCEAVSCFYTQPFFDFGYLFNNFSESQKFVDV